MHSPSVVEIVSYFNISGKFWITCSQYLTEAQLGLKKKHLAFNETEKNKLKCLKICAENAEKQAKLSKIYRIGNFDALIMRFVFVFV